MRVRVHVQVLIINYVLFVLPRTMTSRKLVYVMR